MSVKKVAPRTKLAVTPRHYNFNMRQDEEAEVKFRQLLRTHSRNTEMQKITDRSEVMIGSNGKINGKVLTTRALSQLCSNLAPGLAQTVQNIVGLKRTKGETTYDDNLAIKLINDMIRLRFDLVNGMHAIIDHKVGQICGFVGRKYEFLSNEELYKRVCRFTKKLRETRTSFCEASVHGRRIMMRFKTESPLFRIPVPSGRQEPYYGGFHFSNSEVGECSVRAATVLIREWSNSKAISSFKEGGKLVHLKGSQFDKKFGDLLDNVRVKAELAVALKANIMVLTSKRLGLGGDSKSHKTARKRLEGRLTRKGLYRELAETVVDRLLSQGSYKADRIMSGEVAMEVYSRRTEYDLFNAITTAAKRLPIGAREKAEQVAYQLVLGK